jgi:hypothetical protein
MHRRLGLHIAEGDAQVIGMDLIARDLSPEDPAEHGVPV